MSKQFELGDKVFQAYFGCEQVWIQCPECFGTGRLRVILGDDSEVSIACVCCDRGYEGSPGKLQTYAYVAKVLEVEIVGVTSEIVNGEFRTQYRTTGHYVDSVDNLFSLRCAAESRAEVLKSEYEAEERKRLGYKEKQHKTWAWNVAYWRRSIKKCQQDIERYQERLNAAPKNVKAADLESVAQ